MYKKVIFIITIELGLKWRDMPTQGGWDTVRSVGVDGSAALQ